MESESIISAIDAEIAKLEQVRALLANGGKVDDVTPPKKAKKVIAPNQSRRQHISEND